MDQSEEPLPQELKRRQDRLAEIEAAKQRLEERQAEADRERGRHPDDEQREGMEPGGRSSGRSGYPRTKRRITSPIPSRAS